MPNYTETLQYSILYYLERLFKPVTINWLNSFIPYSGKLISIERVSGHSPPRPMRIGDHNLTLDIVLKIDYTDIELNGNRCFEINCNKTKLSPSEVT